MVWISKTWSITYTVSKNGTRVCNTRAVFVGGLGGWPPRKFLTPPAAIKKTQGGRLSMYLCISTVVDFNSQNFDPPPLMKFDKYSPVQHNLKNGRADRAGFCHGGFLSPPPSLHFHLPSTWLHCAISKFPCFQRYFPLSLRCANVRHVQQYRNTTKWGEDA